MCPSSRRGRSSRNRVRTACRASRNFSRASCWRDLTAADHRRFVRSSVNRFWFLMMGRGLVHPLDLMHAKNPPSHPELLDQLADDFVAHKFDVKYLLRQIALSDAYQRSSVLPEGVDPKSVKPESYRAANPRGLSAEQLAWSLMRATGNLERIIAQPRPKDSKFTYKDYVNGKFPPPGNLPDVMNIFVASFGSPAGNSGSRISAIGKPGTLLDEREAAHALAHGRATITSSIAWRRYRTRKSSPTNFTFPL